jgi:hypothetical protein
MGIGGLGTIVEVVDIFLVIGNVVEEAWHVMVVWFPQQHFL